VARDGVRTFAITFTAQTGEPDATQSFTLTVNQARRSRARTRHLPGGCGYVSVNTDSRRPSITESGTLPLV